MAKKKKKQKSKPKTYLAYENVLECMSCGHEHMHKQRKRVAQKKDSPYLFIRLCPKCGYESYVLIGEKEIRRKYKEEEED